MDIMWIAIAVDMLGYGLGRVDRLSGPAQTAIALE
jgi:hypothetical protein